MKKYAFMIFIIVLAAALFAVAYFIEDEPDKIIYQPRKDLTIPAPTASAEPEAKFIRKTQQVYFYDDGEVFHIKPGCSGMEEINARTCAVALDMGLRPCDICLKDYEIK